MGDCGSFWVACRLPLPNICGVALQDCRTKCQAQNINLHCRHQTLNPNFIFLEEGRAVNATLLKACTCNSAGRSIGSRREDNRQLRFAKQKLSIAVPVFLVDLSFMSCMSAGQHCKY